MVGRSSTINCKGTRPKRRDKLKRGLLEGEQYPLLKEEHIHSRSSLSLCFSLAPLHRCLERSTYPGSKQPPPPGLVASVLGSWATPEVSI